MNFKNIYTRNIDVLFIKNEMARKQFLFNCIVTNKILNKIKRDFLLTNWIFFIIIIIIQQKYHN